MSYSITKAKSFIFRNNQIMENLTNKSIKNTKSVISRNDKENIQKVDKGYRSKLVICIDVLCSLISNGPMLFRQLTDKVELDTIRLIPHLKLLLNLDLIEQEPWGENEIVYSITNRGLKVLTVVNPIIKEAHKISMRNFEIISNTLSEAGYT